MTRIALPAESGRALRRQHDRIADRGVLLGLLHPAPTTTPTPSAALRLRHRRAIRHLPHGRRHA